MQKRRPAIPADPLKRYKSGLAGLRRSRRFVDWSGAREFAAHLESLLDDLGSSRCDARTGVDLVGRFFECDEATLGRCDDSSGIIGNIFRVTARDLWVRFAVRCDEREWLLDRILGLVAQDGYGVRDSVLVAAPEYLAEEEMRLLAERLWAAARKSDDPKYDSTYLHVRIVARALNDPGLHEKATVAWCGGDVGGLASSIAEAYLDAGDATTALRWLEERRDRVREEDRDALLLRVYEEMGDEENRLEVAHRIFRRRPSVQALDQLVEAAGEGRRGEFLEEMAERARIGPLDLDVTAFLLDVGREQDAEDHLVAHREELVRCHYADLLPLANRLQDAGFLLSTICLYRALLESTLARAISKYYGHAVGYLRKLDALAPRIRDWDAVEPHDAYRAKLAEKHRFKRSFWERMQSR